MEYTHATIELRMLFLVAISANEIAEWELRNWFSVVRAVTIAMQQLSKQTLNSGATLFLWGLCRGIILKTIGATEESPSKKISCPHNALV
jgi:hypothetical protein